MFGSSQLAKFDSCSTTGMRSWSAAAGPAAARVTIAHVRTIDSVSGYQNDMSPEKFFVNDKALDPPRLRSLYPPRLPDARKLPMCGPIETMNNTSWQKAPASEATSRP